MNAKVYTSNSDKNKHNNCEIKQTRKMKESEAFLIVICYNLLIIISIAIIIFK